MDWAQPHILLLLILVLPLLWWLQRKSLHPMSPQRRRALWVVRSALTVLLLLGLAGPAWVLKTYDQSIFVMDHSQSQGKSGVQNAFERANQLAESLPRNTSIGFVSAGRITKVLQVPQYGHEPKKPDREIIESDGAQSNLAAAVTMARGLFPPATSRRLVLLTDGVQTRGDLETAARDASVAGITIDAVPVAGEARPDVRAVRLRSSHSRLHEGATLALHADIESSLVGKGRIRLFENGIEVEEQALEMKVGEQRSILFRRTPEQRNLYTYRVRRGL
jgi:Ca-activated chloride channel family protein